MTDHDEEGVNFMEITDNQIASVCHEANRQLQRMFGGKVSEPWDEAPKWMQLSAIEGVEAVIDGATAEELHESWMSTRLSQGWVYGEVKDAEALTHPSLVPYHELPYEERLKDHLFRGIVQALFGGHK